EPAVVPDKPKEEPAVVPDKPKEEPVVVPDKPKEPAVVPETPQRTSVERPQIDYLKNESRGGQGSYSLENRPDEGSVQKVLGLTVAKIPFGKKVNGQIYDYGTYQVTVEPQQVSLMPADKDIPVPKEIMPNQYREYTKPLFTKNGAAAFRLIYDGLTFAIHPVDESALRLLEAGDKARNVDVASQALHTAFKEMGLELEDIDAVYICFD
ncbi:hypothetical protein SAMN05216582_10437, partial [Selenomonas ruminantium]